MRIGYIAAGVVATGFLLAALGGADPSLEQHFIRAYTQDHCRPLTHQVARQQARIDSFHEALATSIIAAVLPHQPHWPALRRSVAAHFAHNPLQRTTP